MQANPGENSVITLKNENGTGENSVRVFSTNGGVDIDAAAGKDVNISGGQVTLSSKTDEASAISLTTNQGTSETIVVTNTQGTGTGAIELTAGAGGIDINATTFDVDTSSNITFDSSGGGISSDAAAASNITTSGGDLTITADANDAKVVIKGDHGGTAIREDGNAAAASIVDIDAGMCVKILMLLEQQL